MHTCCMLQSVCLCMYVYVWCCEHSNTHTHTHIYPHISLFIGHDKGRINIPHYRHNKYYRIFGLFLESTPSLVPYPWALFRSHHLLCALCPNGPGITIVFGSCEKQESISHILGLLFICWFRRVSEFLLPCLFVRCSPATLFLGPSTSSASGSGNVSVVSFALQTAASAIVADQGGPTVQPKLPPIKIPICMWMPIRPYECFEYDI